MEVKLKEFGLDLIEVSDNGSGVSPSNYEGLALKYHTSKLSMFSDLTCVKSFGFRGEALSSLCELAGSFSVTTRTTAESVGVRLTYGRNGKLLKKVLFNATPSLLIVPSSFVLSSVVRLLFLLSLVVLFDDTVRRVFGAGHACCDSWQLASAPSLSSVSRCLMPKGDRPATWPSRFFRRRRRPRVRSGRPSVYPTCSNRCQSDAGSSGGTSRSSTTAFCAGCRHTPSSALAPGLR